jgi:hypothetical protein
MDWGDCVQAEVTAARPAVASTTADAAAGSAPFTAWHAAAAAAEPPATAAFGYPATAPDDGDGAQHLFRGGSSRGSKPRRGQGNFGAFYKNNRGA